jgi:hypothetical protein
MGRLCAAALILAILVTPSPTVQAQNRLLPADLAGLEGTWVLDIARSGLTPADAEQRVIKTGPTWLRLDIQRASSASPIALIYNLDGSQNINAFGSETAVTRLNRQGEQVVLETVFTVNSQAVTVHELLPLVPTGFDLTVEVALRVEHGYQGVALPGQSRGAQPPPNVSNGTKIFRKQI